MGAEFFIKKYLDQLFKQSDQIDAVLLACTHYPLLEAKIKANAPQHVKFISQGDIVAQSLSLYLENHPEMAQKCSKNGQISFYTTDNEQVFEQQAGLFFGQKIAAKHTDLT